MENNKGVLSHLGGIVRIILLIIFIAIITFFVVRFFRNRQAERRAQDSSQVSQQNGQQNGSDNRAEEESRGSGGSEREDQSSGTSSTESRDQNNIPSGIDDGGGASTSRPVPNAGPSAIPETGASTSIFVTAGLLGIITYLLAKNRALSVKRSNL